MTILILLCLIFILVILNLVYSPKKQFEGYYDSNDVNVLYPKFIKFYRHFCPLWKNAINTAVMTNSPQQPLTSPSQISDTGSNSSLTITDDDMNQYITQLSSTDNIQYPTICIDLPEDLSDVNKLQMIANNIPSDSTPYINALNWIIGHLSKSHGNLQSALSGNFLKEGFDNCQEVEKCLSMQENKIKQQISTSILSFFSNEDQLNSVLKKTEELVKKSNDIANQAQNGQLLNQINIQDNSYYGETVLPDGANNLGNLKDSNPQRYEELKSNYSLWFNLKTLMEGINNNL